MAITVEPLAYVRNEREEITDDYWGKVQSEIRLVEQMPDDALKGLDEFSHLEIIFCFHRADSAKTATGARHPRNNPAYPPVGVFARRGKNRPNHLGLTIVKLLEVHARSIEVRGLDAINGTPVLDIKPILNGFLPKEPVRQPWWAEDIMRDYWKS